MTLKGTKPLRAHHVTALTSDQLVLTEIISQKKRLYYALDLGMS